ncbi:hypothetical protein, partial [Vibrio lentus]|uniref:hypothetical protein n=1 Tax=Vibrio lentus TaxID=136468 RepID=UPI001A7E0E70
SGSSGSSISWSKDGNATVGIAEAFTTSQDVEQYYIATMHNNTPYILDPEVKLNGQLVVDNVLYGKILSENNSNRSVLICVNEGLSDCTEPKLVNPNLTSIKSN